MAICRKQLEDMGFLEITKDLFMKDKGNGTKIYRDYRTGSRKSYAYHRNRTIPKENFKELLAIEKIEKAMSGNVLAYC